MGQDIARAADGYRNPAAANGALVLSAEELDAPRQLLASRAVQGRGATVLATA